MLLRYGRKHWYYSVSSDSLVKVFDDKIEFYNPGRLPDNITVEDLLTFSNKSVPRNKLIADFFKELGIIEKYGSGIKRIVSNCSEYGLPAPRFENISEGFMVTLFARTDSKIKSKVPDKPEVINENQHKIMLLLFQNNRLSLSELAQMIGMSKRKMLDNVNLLKDKGLLIRVGSPKSGYWQVKEKTGKNINLKWPL